MRLAGLPPKELSAARAEVAALKKVSHPHIIKYEDSLVQDETLCIVMEYAAGKDLSALIAKCKQENKPLEEKEVLKIFYQVCSALSYCHHDLKMLHRDLKPQNIFLTADGDVKLGDFGLAKCVEATCALAQTQCGTPVYMSPELCMGDSYNRAADVWALGCVLYELMTRQLPYAGYAAAQVVMSVITNLLDRPTLPEDAQHYPEALANLMRECWAFDATSRPDFAAILDSLERMATEAGMPFDV